MKNLDGEWSEPENQVLVPATDEPEPYFKFGETDKSLLIAHKNPWRVVADDKSQPTHRMAGTQKSLDRVYEFAIALGTPAGVGKGWGWVGIIIGAVGLCSSIAITFQIISDEYLNEKIYSSIFGVLLGFLWLIISILIIVFFIRGDYFSPRDQPIIFNRKTRQVSFVRVPMPHFIKVWRSRKPQFKTYPWDSVKVRSYKYLEGSAKAMHDAYLLCLLWGDEPDHPTQFKDWVALGYRGWWEDQRLLQLWEHVRQYMEENGPPIQKGEQLRQGVYGKWLAPMPVFPADVLAAAGRQLTDDEIKAYTD